MLNSPMYRPPAEAHSLILQVDQGCPYNRCTFCSMYSGVPYVRRNIDEIRKIVAGERGRDGRRIFLADGDVMRRPFGEIREILELLLDAFPGVSRINTYATGSGILDKSAEELTELKRLKMHTLYMGLESGCEDTLRLVRKGETAGQMVEAAVRAQECGLHISVMVLLGLAGQLGSRVHAHDTATALNRMQPRLLSFLRVIPVPGSEFERQLESGHIVQMTEHEVVAELRSIISGLDLSRTVLRANHSSNIVPIEARLPRDRQSLLGQLDALLAAGRLDVKGPGRMPLWL